MTEGNRLKELEQELRDIIRDAYEHEDNAYSLDDELRDLEINRHLMNEEAYYEQEDRLIRQQNDDNNMAQYYWSCAEDVKYQISEIVGYEVSYEEYTER